MNYSRRHADILKLIQEEGTITITRLAEKLGVSDKSVSKWERGVCLPDVSLYTELCAALGIDFDPAMLHWRPGSRSTDGIWGRHWYGAVETSTGFGPPETGIGSAYQPSRPMAGTGIYEFGG